MAAACAAALALGVAACGEDDPDEAERARTAVERFETAVDRGDLSLICKEILSQRIVAKLTSVGLPCEVAAKAFRDVDAPKLKILSVKIQGAKAFVRVRTNAAGQPPSEDTIRLVQQGDDWRIDDLASSAAGPPTPRGPGIE